MSSVSESERVQTEPRCPLYSPLPVLQYPIMHCRSWEKSTTNNRGRNKRSWRLTSPSRHMTGSPQNYKSLGIFMFVYGYSLREKLHFNFFNTHSFCLLLSSRLSGADDGVSPAWRDDGLGKAPTPPVPQAWMSRVSEEENHSRGEIQENLSKLFTQHPIPGKLQAHSPWSMTGEGKEDCRTRHELD